MLQARLLELHMCGVGVASEPRDSLLGCSIGEHTAVEQWPAELRNIIAAVFSNMAAAHSHSRQGTAALECCELALRIRPGYAKALLTVCTSAPLDLAEPHRHTGRLCFSAPRYEWLPITSGLLLRICNRCSCQ